MMRYRRPTKYQTLRDAGYLHGTIKRATRLRRERDERAKCNDPMLLSRDERIKRSRHLLMLGGNEQVAAACERIRSEHPRRKNWTNSESGLRSHCQENNGGQYSGRCRYTHWTYTPVVESWARVVHGAVWFHFDGSRTRIAAPYGYEWRTDEDGVYLYSRRLKADYHPTAADLMAGKRKIVRLLKEHRNRRVAAAKQRRKQLAVIKRAEAEGATVCLRDSTRAGNCLSGSSMWARRHGFDVKSHYRPSEVLAKANGDAGRVTIVVAFALKRHAEEMRRGYANLSEHYA